MPLKESVLAMLKAKACSNSIDVHGRTKAEAELIITQAIYNAYDAGKMEIRVIHGYNSGTIIKDMIQTEIVKLDEVQRVEPVLGNSGETRIILKFQAE